jgi:hypothetical protein
MKTARTLLVAALAGLALAGASAPAAAAGYYGGHYGGGHYYGGHYHGGYWGGPRVTFGFYGGPWYWGPGYWGAGWGYPYGYYPPTTVVVPSEPSVYVERDSVAPAAQQWWYWCPSAKGYYPYVSTCPEGWQRVAPQPPQGPQ